MSTAPALPFSEACERNKGPILEVLLDAFARARQVLEIGSGTGQHAVWFAQGLPHLIWQPSDMPEHLASLRARFESEAPDNLRSPLPLDVASHPWPALMVDAVFSANTLHIMSAVHVEHFFRGVGEVLGDGGTLCVYGPFRYGGKYTTPSNAEFDFWLKRRDPVSGIRDFEAVNALAEAQGLALLADHAMPANNQTLVWRKETKA